MVLTRLQEENIIEQNRQLYLTEINRLGSIKIEQTFPTQATEIFTARRPLIFEMTEKLLSSRISKQLDQWPTFGGKLNENVTKWLKDITNELNLVKFNDDDKLIIIQTYLTGDARKWFINNMAAFESWSQFRVALLQMYSSTFAKEAAISQVAQRSQGINESVMHYYNEMMELFDVMDSEMSASLKVSYLKHGLKPSLKKEVSRKNPLTPGEFLKAAQEEESLDESAVGSVQHWEMPVKSEVHPGVSTTTTDLPSGQQNDHHMSYMQYPGEIDNANFYARITTSDKQRQHRPQQQPSQQQQQWQPWQYQQQQPSQQQQQWQPWQHQQQQQQQQQQYTYQAQKRCYRCNRSGHLARDCRYSKNY